MKKVSIICCTEDRVDFYPWLAFTYNSLRLPKGYEKELVVIDSTLNAEESYGRLEELIPGSQLRYSLLKPGTPLGEKRNAGLDLSTGDLFGWLDDDDSKAPGWLHWAIETLGNYHVLTVKAKVMFLNIAMEPMRARWVPTKWYSGGLYTRKVAEVVRFADSVPVGEDVAWQGRVWASFEKKRQLHVQEEGIGFALTHTRNIANRFAKPGRWKTKGPIPRPGTYSPREWNKTLAKIQELRRVLGYVE